MVFLIRHAPTVWNLHRIGFGRTDIPLSSEGRAQAARFDTARVIPCQVIYTSPLARAQETAQLIGLRLHIPVVPVPALIERDHGEGEGVPKTQLPPIVPGRETDEQIRARVLPFLRLLTPECAVVTHAGVIHAVTSKKVNHLEVLEWSP